MIKNLSFCLIFFIFSGTAFTQSNIHIINHIQIAGNRITKESIILRELSFQEGDTIKIANLEQHLNRSRENLLNTSLFNFVTITPINNHSHFEDILIIVEERWYTWPSLILNYDDRNFSAWLKSKDLSRSKIGFSVDRFNCFGRKETFGFSFLFGYEKQFTISYKNIALDKNRRHFIGGDIELTRQDELIFITSGNEPLSFRNNYNSVFERKKYTLNYVYRPYINNSHNFYLNFFEYNVSDTIIKLNPDFLVNKNSHLEAFTLDYIFARDNRDIKAYPLKGSYFELFIGQTLSIPFRATSFSSTIIIPSYYKYFELSNNLYFSTGINLKISYNNTYSYFYSKALGYNHNLHGFEYNTIEGQHFILFKNLFKIALLKPRVSEISFIPFPKFNKIHYAFYFNVYADCGYVVNKYNTPLNNYANKFLYSGGVGIDFVTYYDRTIRAEYSINGFGVAGFYLHLTAPINH